MPPGMKYWDDCVDPEDMLAMWSHVDVRKEWIAAGEAPGSKVHMSRNPDGHPYLTQTEMRAVAELIIGRHFKRRLDPSMICAIAEIESHRQPLAHRYEPKLKEASTGLMQVLASTAEWLVKDMSFNAYSADMLYRPFVCVYFGAAYLKWLSTYEHKRRSEEFMVRAYNSGPKHATSKFTLGYWNRYLQAKQNLPIGRELPVLESPASTPAPAHLGSAAVQPSPSPGRQWIYWEERTSAQDMAEMWRQPDVKKEWTKAGEKPGKVRFSRDTQMRPFVTRTELKAIAGIIVSRYFTDRGISPAMLCTLADISSKRLLFGLESPTGLMQTPYTTALWLYSDLGYKSYRLRSCEDLTKPFVSMYFGAAYVSWLAGYKNRTRSDQFIVQSYRGGPLCVDSAEAGPFWLKYLDTLPEYHPRPKSQQGSCTIQ
ncbi:uncharacterized protein LOC9661703 [Selaginella moellendorffii]|uniref:uncharacterized protein LOC9661703 n=1 Tax=Selaginella moellendorffii TaxID=88036 RepID=UPI000D1CA75C|nr:uncharacterized protein LOC9661703 [Selaginella moellendorffii]|eukprot:XP_024543450.1 uncharacterized protein LOC9661703 [Selaginella moellendorffii]